MTLLDGCILNGFRKQRLHTRSSTEGKLVGTDGMSQLIFWTKLFLEAQCHKIKHNILCQDNKSAILLLENGKNSSTERTHALNICHFCLADQIEKENIKVEHYSTDNMVADCHSK